MPKFGGPGLNGKPCRLQKHCLEDCGRCNACREKEKFGGSKENAETRCSVKGKRMRRDRSTYKGKMYDLLNSQGQRVKREDLVDEEHMEIQVTHWNTGEQFDEEGKLKANCSNLRRKIWKKLKYSEGIEYYVCEICFYGTKDRNILIKHMVVHIQKGDENVVPSEGTSEDEEILNERNRWESRKSHKEKTFSCNLCGESYDTLMKMNIHKENFHKKECTICPYCDMDFSHNPEGRHEYHRNRHIMMVHKIIPQGFPYVKCDMCDFFANENDTAKMKRHKQGHKQGHKNAKHKDNNTNNNEN